MKRGELWWAIIDKRRPVVLLSRDEAYEVRSNVVVAPISTTIRSYAVEVKSGRREGLDHTSVINCDWITTIRKDQLERRIGAHRAAGNEAREVHRRRPGLDPFLFLRLDDDIAAAAAIAAGRTAEFDEFFAAERHAAVAAITGADIDLCFVKEFHAS